jgi:hypothetical protein
MYLAYTKDSTKIIKIKIDEVLIFGIIEIYPYT